MKTLYHNGNRLMIQPEVLTALKLRDGQAIDEATMWRAIDLNTSATRAKVEATRDLTQQSKRGSTKSWTSWSA